MPSFESHISTSLVSSILKNKESYYRKGSFKKKNGSIKSRYSPQSPIREIQTHIHNYLNKIPVSDHATAYKKKTSILKNAQKHRFSKHFMKLDFENFFNSLTSKHITYALMKNGINDDDAEFIAHACTINDRLFYGGITSPILSNIIMKEFDDKIETYLKNTHSDIIYSRYSDDLTFSASDNYEQFHLIKNKIQKIASDLLGLKLNHSKTKILSVKCNRVSITGLIISLSKYDFGNDAIGLGRKTKRLIRARIFNLFNKNLSKEEFIKEHRSLIGSLNYAKSVDTVGYEQLLFFYKHQKMKFSNPNR